MVGSGQLGYQCTQGCIFIKAEAVRFLVYGRVVEFTHCHGQYFEG